MGVERIEQVEMGKIQETEWEEHREKRQTEQIWRVEVALYNSSKGRQAQRNNAEKDGTSQAATENHSCILDRRVTVQMEKQHWQEVQIERVVSELCPVKAVSSAAVGDSEGYTASR